MQLHSIFSFLGKSATSSDSDVDASAGTSQATGFGAILSSTLALLAHKGDHAVGSESAAEDRQAGAGEIAESDTEAQTDVPNEAAGELIPRAEAGSDSDYASPLVDDSGKSLADGAQDELPNSSARSDGDVQLRDRHRPNNHPSGNPQTDGDSSMKGRADLAANGDSQAGAASSGRQQGHATSGAHSDAGGSGRTHHESAGSGRTHHESTGSGRAHSEASGDPDALSKARAVDLAHSATGSAGNGGPTANAAGNGLSDAGGARDARFEADALANARIGNDVNGSDTHRLRPDSSASNRANVSGDGEIVLRGQTGGNSAATFGAADDARGASPSNNQLPPVNADADPETAAYSSDARRSSSPTGATGDHQLGIGSASKSKNPVNGALGVTGKSIHDSEERRLWTETRTSVDTTGSHAHEESATATGTGGSNSGEPSGKQMETSKNERTSAPSNGRLASTSSEGRTTSAPRDGRVSSDPDETPAAATQRSTVNGRSPAEPLRVAELERSANRLSADRIRISVELPTANSSPHASGEPQASRLDRSALEARIAAEHDNAPGAGTDGQSGSTTRAAKAAANTASANTASANAASGGGASLDGLPAAEAVEVTPTKLTGAEETKHSSVGPAELDTQSRAAAKPSGADDRAGRDARADGDRTDSRAASTDRAGSGDATNTGADQQSNFASGTDSAPDDAFDVAAAERSGDTLGFDGLLHEDVQTDGEPTIDMQFSESTDEMTFSPDKARSAGPTSHAAEAQRPSQPRQGGIVNWVRARLEDGLKAISIDEGWKVLEMKLDEGQGTMTIRARRDEEKVSITVNFTDPQLRALAAENADRLQESLRSQYQADVDFSLMSDNPDQSQRQSNGGPQGGGRPADPTLVSSQSISGADRARAARAAHSGARNEWIG